MSLNVKFLMDSIKSTVIWKFYLATTTNTTITTPVVATGGVVSQQSVPSNGGLISPNVATPPTAMAATPMPAAKKPGLPGKTAAFSRWKKLTGTAMFINRLGKTGRSMS